MKKQYTNKRPTIPADIRRTVEVEAGHQCTVKACYEHTYLEIHHISQNREDNKIDNLILLCDKHHKMAHANIIDRKALREYKKLLNQHHKTIISDTFYSNLATDFGNQIQNIGLHWLRSLPDINLALKIDEYNKLYSLVNWLNSRDWATNNSNPTLNYSFQTLSKNITLTLETFGLHLTTQNDYYVTEKFYKNIDFDLDPKRSKELNKQYTAHRDKLSDLTFEVAKNFNEVFRNIRKEIDSSFLLDMGIIPSLHGRKLV